MKAFCRRKDKHKITRLSIMKAAIAAVVVVLTITLVMTAAITVVIPQAFAKVNYNADFSVSNGGASVKSLGADATGGSGGYFTRSPDGSTSNSGGGAFNDGNTVGGHGGKVHVILPVLANQ